MIDTAKIDVIVSSIIQSLGEHEEGVEHSYEIKFYAGKWWITHQQVGSGQPVDQWLEDVIKEAL
jgi:hypothetical protein